MSTTFAAFVESNPVVGSSRNIMPGDMRSSVAMETRRFSPPDRPRENWSPIKESASFSMPKSRMVWPTRRRRAFVDVPIGIRSVAWNNKCSQTVLVPGKTSSWVTHALAARKPTFEATCPSKYIAPRTFLSGGVRPASVSMSVDLPAPLGPKTANTPPGPAIPETSLKMCFVLFFLSFLTLASTKRCRHESTIISFDDLCGICVDNDDVRLLLFLLARFFLVFFSSPFSSSKLSLSLLTSSSPSASLLDDDDDDSLFTELYPSSEYAAESFKSASVFKSSSRTTTSDSSSSSSLYLCFRSQRTYITIPAIITDTNNNINARVNASPVQYTGTVSSNEHQFSFSIVCSSYTQLPTLQVTASVGITPGCVQ